jgi:hypothetical protein
MSNAGAVRYRRLALASGDRTNVDLLLKLADESDRGMLCTAEWLSARPSLKNEQPPKAVDVRVPVEWDPFSAMH